MTDKNTQQYLHDLNSLDHEIASHKQEAVDFGKMYLRTILTISGGAIAAIPHVFKIFSSEQMLTEIHRVVDNFAWAIGLSLLCIASTYITESIATRMCFAKRHHREAKDTEFETIKYKFSKNEEDRKLYTDIETLAAETWSDVKLAYTIWLSFYLMTVFLAGFAGLQVLFGLSDAIDVLQSACLKDSPCNL